MYLDALYNAPIKGSVRRNLTIVSPSDSVFSLVVNMVRDDVGAAVVVEGGQTVGIITEKDVLERVLLPEKNIYQTFVKDVMTKSPVSIEVDCPIKEVLDLMQKHKIRRLIVTENDALFGLVTERRILKLINFRISDIFEHFLDQKDLK